MQVIRINLLNSPSTGTEAVFRRGVCQEMVHTKKTVTSYYNSEALSRKTSQKQKNLISFHLLPTAMATCCSVFVFIVYFCLCHQNISFSRQSPAVCLAQTSLLYNSGYT